MLSTQFYKNTIKRGPQPQPQSGTQAKCPSGSRYLKVDVLWDLVLEVWYPLEVDVLCRYYWDVNIVKVEDLSRYLKVDVL